MYKLLVCWDKINKGKHVKHCHEQQKHFYLFVLSIYCMLGKEDLVVLANLSGLMSTKMGGPIFHVRVWINGRVAIEVARS